MHPAVVLLVLLTQLVGTHAKRGAHCVHGLCLVLMPGHQIGPVRPGDTIGAEVARIPSAEPYASQLVSNGIPTKTRKLNVYYPTLPGTGAFHVLKLWEGTTLRVVEHSTIGPGLTLNPDTHAFTSECGGIPLTAKNMSSMPSRRQCVRIRRGTGDDPVLITSREPFEFTAPVLKEQADVILMQVRNPVDAYQSLFIEQNPQYVQTNGIAKLQWQVTFQQYLNSCWAKYLQSFDDVKVPRVVLRYEDMVVNPVDFTKEALVYTGVVREMMLQDKNITASVHYVQSKTQAVTEPVGFGFRTLMNLDESNQLKTLRLLEAYQPILRALGYYYYREQDGVPEDMKVLLKEHIDIQTADEKERLEVLEEAGMTHRDGVHSELFNSGIPFINLHTALSLAILMLSASVALYVCGKAYQLVANGSGAAAPLLPSAQVLKSKLGAGGGKGTQAVESLKERLRQTINRQQPADSKDAPSTAITDAAENSHKLARLKTLRNQLSSTAYY